MMNMRRFLVVISMTFLLSIDVEAATSIARPFGGTVTAMQPCNTGLLLYIRTANLTWGFNVVPYMWFWGNLPFLSKIPPHPGQNMLGMVGPTPVPCVTGFVPTGAGLPILYHGASL
jgi:hypothetical protein